MRSFLTLACTLLALQPASAQHLPTDAMQTDTIGLTYRVYTGRGQPASLLDIVAVLQDAEVVFVGEQHDDPVAHNIQHELLNHSYVRYGTPTSNPRAVALSLEMFERDVQHILDEYLEGLITDEHFIRSSRPWDNYATDYRPLVEFAKAHHLPVIAANAPRRYVNRVTRLGPSALDTLSAWAKTWLPPLPYPGPTPAYEARWNQFMAEMMAGRAASTESENTKFEPDAEPSLSERTDTTENPSPPMHRMGYALDAQALWDASMAQAIARHLYAMPGALVLHMAGNFHVEQFDIAAHTGLGDFVILSDESLPRTFGSTRTP